MLHTHARKVRSAASTSRAVDPVFPTTELVQFPLTMELCVLAPDLHASPWRRISMFLSITASVFYCTALSSVQKQLTYPMFYTRTVRAAGCGSECLMWTDALQQ